MERIIAETMEHLGDKHNTEEKKKDALLAPGKSNIL